MALIPSDPYSVSIGKLENACGQTIWESVQDFIVGDYRLVRVGEETDRDKSLDFIKPFEGF
jgi:hypothetical protein